MRRFYAVALREVAERRFVLVAAAAAAVIPFLVPLVPGVPSGEAAAARSIMGLVLASAFGLGGALLVGASVVGRELGERRLTFHFSRPLPGAFVWGGKLVGGLALVLFTELIVYLPSSAASGFFPGIVDGRATAIGVILLLPVPLFLLAWVCSVALRSRSPWLVLDLAFLVALPVLLFVLLRRYGRYGVAPGPDDVIVILGIFLAALVAATLLQVVAGRTDPRRGHGAQSLALWGVLFAATALGALWGERTMDPGIDQLFRIRAEAADAGGNWVCVTGARHERGGGVATYLVNLPTGRTILLPGSDMQVVSADGSRAAYVGLGPLPPWKRSITVDTLDLGTGEATSTDLPEWPEALALSADGRRLAVVSREICSVLELPERRIVASARIPSARWSYSARFVTEDLVRVLPIRSWRSSRGTPNLDAAQAADPTAFELDVAKKALTPLATYSLSSIPGSPSDGVGPNPGRIFVIRSSSDRSRLLADGLGSAHAARLFDATTGRVLFSIDGSRETGRPYGDFLSDGRVVLAEPAPEGRRLALLSPDGARLSTIALPKGTARVRFGLEPAKGLLVVGTSTESVSDRWAWHLLDLESGLLRPLGVEGLLRAFWSGGSPLPPAGSPAARLAFDARHRLVLFDPATGATKPLTRGAPAAK